MNRRNNSERDELLNRYVWRLARSHTWGGEVEFEESLRLAFPDSRRGEARSVLRPLLKSFGVYFLHWSESDEEAVRMRGDRRVALAYYLRDEAGFEEWRIETTVSRFRDTDGGFEGTHPPDVSYVEWP